MTTELRTATILAALTVTAGILVSQCAPEPTGVVERLPGREEHALRTAVVGEKVFVVERGGGSVAVIDRVGMTVTNTIPVGNNPTSLAVSPNGEELLVTVTGVAACFSYPALPNDGSIAVISIAQETVARTYSLGHSPWDIVTADGTTAFVSDHSDAAILKIDIETGALIETIRNPSFDTPQGLALTPDGANLYVANVGYINGQCFDPPRPPAPPNVTVVRTSDSSIIDIVDVSAISARYGPWDITMLPDGSAAYTSDGDQGQSIFEIDTDPASAFYHAVTAQIGFGRAINPRGMASGLTPSGARVFATLMRGVSPSPGLLVIDPTAQVVTHTIPLPGEPWRVSVSPDGEEVWVSLRSADEVVVLETSGYTEIGRITGLSQPADIAFAAPLTPEQRIERILEDIEDLVNSGAVDSQEMSGLTGTLGAVLHQLDGGNSNTARNLLEAFVRQVQAMERSGRLSANDAEALIESAEGAIASL